MELFAILLASLSGAIIGTCVGVFLMYLRLRPISNAELEQLRGKLRTAEFSVESANANLENMKKLVAERDQAAQQSGDELKENQKQLEAARASMEEANAQRADAERRIRDLNIEATALREQVTELESRASVEKVQAAEHVVQELAAAQVQQETDRQRIEELTAQLAGLSGEIAAMQQGREETARSRASLEQQLRDEQEQNRELSSHISELQSELARSDLRLREERQSTAKGMELLAMAQASLLRVVRPAGAEVAAAPNGHETVEVALAQVAAPASNEPAEAVAVPASN